MGTGGSDVHGATSVFLLVSRFNSFFAGSVLL
jgi:hypothetical protein